MIFHSFFKLVCSVYHCEFIAADVFVFLHKESKFICVKTLCMDPDIDAILGVAGVFLKEEIMLPLTG